MALRFPVLILLYLLSLLVCSTAIPRQSHGENTASQWNMILTRVALPDNFQLFLDLHPRFDLEDSDGHGGAGIRQFLVRPGLGYRWNKRIQTSIGYTLLENYNPEKTEHDIFEDFIYTKNLADLTLLQRLRAEHRFLESDGEIWHRLRALIQLQKPIHPERRLNLVISNEFFFALNDVTPAHQAGFIENRAFAGLGAPIRENVSLTAGYQNQFREGRVDRKDRVNHIILLNLIVDLDSKSTELAGPAGDPDRFGRH